MLQFPSSINFDINTFKKEPKDKIENILKQKTMLYFSTSFYFVFLYSAAFLKQIRHNNKFFTLSIIIIIIYYINTDLLSLTIQKF